MACLMAVPPVQGPASTLTPSSESSSGDGTACEAPGEFRSCARGDPAVRFGRFRLDAPPVNCWRSTPPARESGAVVEFRETGEIGKDVKSESAAVPVLGR